MTDPETVLDADALKYILSLPKGRKVIWGLLAFSGLFRQPFVPGEPDKTALNSGALNVGLMLYGDCLAVSPDLTAMMTKEQGNDDNQRDSDDTILRVAASRSRSGDDDRDPLDIERDPLNLGFDRSGE